MDRKFEKIASPLDLSKWEPLTAEPTDEELKLAEQCTEFYTTEEVIAHLRSSDSQ